MKKALSVFLTVCLMTVLFFGCKDKNTAVDENEISAAETTTVQSISSDDMFSGKDGKTDYDEDGAIKIELNGATAYASDDSVKISGTTVTITKEATHIISGTLNDGMIIVEAPDTAKLQLVLNSASIASSTSAPLYIKEADKVFVTLVGENSLTSGESFTAIDDNNIDGAVFSKQDLTFNGDGSLTVSSPAGHGIVGKDDLVFTGGTYTITSASHGIQANDSVRIKDSYVSADAGKDGIHCENTDDTSKGYIYIESGEFKIESEGDGISASSYVNIVDGAFEILAGGGCENGEKEQSDNFGQFGGGGGMHGGMFGGRTDGKPEGGRSEMPGGEGGMMKPDSVKPDDMPEMQAMETEAVTDEDGATSMKGIKAAGNMLIEGGTFNINSADDSIHSDTSVTVNGGTFEIASGDDALHAEESLTVKDGKINITNSYEGLEALHVTVSGGEIKLVASDDGLNAAGGADSSGFGGRDEMFGGRGGGMSANSNGSIVISGGTIYINASGDGIDANGTLEITGGNTTVTGPTYGDTAVLDYDKTAVISGGTFIGTGASSMAQTFSTSEQGVISVSVGNQSAGTEITVKDKSGNEIVSSVPELSYQIAVISTPEIKSGETYTVTVGALSEEFKAS